MWRYTNSDELYHHGVKGQKWGVRRYQNEDGSLTSAGKKRYSDDDAPDNQGGSKRRGSSKGGTAKKELTREERRAKEKAEKEAKKKAEEEAEAAKRAEIEKHMTEQEKMEYSIKKGEQAYNKVYSVWRDAPDPDDVEKLSVQERVDYERYMLRKEKLDKERAQKERNIEAATNAVQFFGSNGQDVDAGKMWVASMMASYLDDWDD